MKSDTNEVEVKKTSLGAYASNEVSLLERIVNSLDKLNYVLNNGVHRVSQVLLFILMLLTTGDVVGRYFFNKPITGTYELTGLGLAIIIFFSLGMAQIKKDHIVIDFITNKLPLKVREALNVLTSFILLILLSLTTWQLIEYTKRLWNGHNTSGDLGLPLFIFTILTAVGALVFTISILVDMFKSFLKVVQRNES